MIYNDDNKAMIFLYFVTPFADICKYDLQKRNTILF